MPRPVGIKVQYEEAKWTGLCKIEPVNFTSPYSIRIKKVFYDKIFTKCIKMEFPQHLRRGLGITSN